MVYSFISLKKNLFHFFFFPFLVVDSGVCTLPHDSWSLVMEVWGLTDTCILTWNKALSPKNCSWKTPVTLFIQERRAGAQYASLHKFRRMFPPVFKSFTGFFSFFLFFSQAIYQEQELAFMFWSHQSGCKGGIVAISQLVTDRHRPFCCEIPFTGHLTLREHVPPARSN